MSKGTPGTADFISLIKEKTSPIIDAKRGGRMSKMLEGVEEFVVKKYNGEFPDIPKNCPEENIKIGICLDTETTGLSHEKDEITEICAIKFEFDKETGCIYGLTGMFHSMNEPSKPITEKITKLTGITNEMVKGHSIDWKKFDEFVEDSSIIIAHNAPFDRKFVDKHSEITQQRIWGCSRAQVDWSEEGCGHASLVYLCQLHRFFYDAHRAEIDVKATLKLLRNKGYNGEYYFKQIIDASRKPFFLARAVNSSFETKDIWKENGFRWNAKEKIWEKEIDETQYEEIQKLFEKTYYPRKSQGEFKRFSPYDRFK